MTLLPFSSTLAFLAFSYTAAVFFPAILSRIITSDDYADIHHLADSPADINSASVFYHLQRQHFFATYPRPLILQ